MSDLIVSINIFYYLKLMKSKRKNKNNNENELDRYFTKDEIIGLIKNDLGLNFEELGHLDYDILKELLEKEAINKLLKENLATEELYKLGENFVYNP
jgi:hypothetical protein